MKQLITDQLIEKYEREIKEIKDSKQVFTSNTFTKYNTLIQTYQQFIADLKSIRQQEMQNVMTAYRDGEVVCHLYNDSNDYFNQTFKQPQS